MTVSVIRRLSICGKNHYSSLLNSVDSSRDKDRGLSYLNDCSSDYSAISISVDDVSNGLKHVDNNNNNNNNNIFGLNTSI